MIGSESNLANGLVAGELEMMKYHILMDALPSMVWLLDREGKIVRANRAAANFFKIPETRTHRLDPRDLYEKQFVERIQNENLELICCGHEIRNRMERFTSCQGAEHWARTDRIPVLDKNGAVVGLLFIAQDVTEQYQVQAYMEYLHIHDRLTGLFNRKYFESCLKRAYEPHNLPVTFIMADINGLKLVNDALGIEWGDFLLEITARRLARALRQGDILARWGSDEFIAMLPSCEQGQAACVMEHIREECGSFPEIPVPVSLSMGMATRSQSGQEITLVIKEAEEMMNRHKLTEALSARSSFVLSLQKTLWTRSNETEEHCERVRRTAISIGKALCLPENELDNISLLAALHDIGKIAVPDVILEKTGQLLPEEWSYIHRHPEIGYHIAISCPEIAPIAEAILHHHERWDGRGYPRGMQGSEIPLLSRIIAVADAFDVMTTGRSYQQAVSIEEARLELRRCSGSQFDPLIVKSFLEL